MQHVSSMFVYSYSTLHETVKLHFSSMQLTTYWEKTFKVDLFRPQIGVVNVTDVNPFILSACIRFIYSINWNLFENPKNSLMQLF